MLSCIFKSPVALLLFVVYSLSVVQALPVDPNATLGLSVVDNITFVAEAVISIPVEISPPRDQALARLGAKLPPAGAIQNALESRGDILAPIGDFLQRILNSIMGGLDPHPAPAL